MITPEFCRTMARYNAWQNVGLRRMVAEIDNEVLRKERGAFFGSIVGTLNHALWGDMIWIARFDGGATTDVHLQDSATFTPTAAVWAADRFRMDARITLWAQSASAIDLTGEVSWASTAAKRQVTKSKTLCVMQMFNHQTHHRGQVHAMLTSIGLKPNDTDLPFMPE